MNTLLNIVHQYIVLDNQNPMAKRAIRKDSLENNHLKCDDYSLLFSMRTDDDEQYFD